jgi:hypothetical protein
MQFLKTFYKVTKFKIPFKAVFFSIGIVSTVWFLIRVIPKPSRASYPCMRAAAPIMSSFILYLIALSGSVMVFRKAKKHFIRSKYIAAAGLFLIAISLFALAGHLNLKTIYAQIKSANATKILPNLPVGEPRGIFPGRVVWAWNPDATDINCTNKPNDAVRGADGYFLAKNNNQSVVDSMLNDAVRKITGASSVKNAWSALFKSFHEYKGMGSEGYIPGQKIFIKVNLGGGGWLTNSNDLSLISLPWAVGYYGMAETSPAIMIALLKQLVTVYGVQEKDIYLGDPIAHIYKHVYDQLVAVFPDVKYVDKDHSDIGRTKLTIPATPVIFYSDQGTVMPLAVSDKMYTEMQNADYLINIAALKAHARAGVTLNTKNNFGSHTRPGADHLHNGLIAAENDQPTRTEYGTYRVLTDLMGHERLGGNTLLFIIDGLWGGTEAVEKPVKWNMAPFNGDWPNSIFIAQDPVAIESVCMDFLRSEFTNPNGPGKARPQFGAVDDYLLQAADSSFWPKDIQYDPESDGIIMGSLGICEHWNNSDNKQYSRNLGYNKGIELVSTAPSLLKSSMIAFEAETPPAFDGEENDICWTGAKWYPIDQTWITWGQKIDSSDFHGEFKISWSSSDNLMYFLVRVTDDAFIDGYVYPGDGYPNFDIVEVFIDEDKSGGLHVFDNNPTLGQNAENAFSYHLATSQPADGETSTDLVSCDISGTDWNNRVIENYAFHFPDFIMKRNGNVYTYEFSMKVFSDTYSKSNPENSRVTLAENKLMGLSLAYCDNDDPDGQRDNFFGSVWVPETQYNDHWMNANGFGSVRLSAPLSGVNHAVVSTSEIADFTILEKNKTLTIIEDLLTHFFDPDKDTLTFSVQCLSGYLHFDTGQNKLTVHADNGFSGDVLVTITATDGQSEASLSFMIIDQTTGIINNNLSGKLTIYPNPATEILFLTLPAKTNNQTFSVEVYSMNGKRIMSENFNLKESREVIQLNVKHLKSGSYVIRAIGGRESFNEVFYKK